MKKEIKKIAGNVMDFDYRCSRIIGNLECDSFSIDNFNEFQDHPIDSPIEQIFYLAFKTLRRANCIEKSDVYEDTEGKPYILGLGIWPQIEISNYRVDFLADYWPKKNDKHEVIIECDSQTYHERNEKERRYEKQRDRFLHKSGYKVFRFTGSEIVKNPFECASEVISFLTNIDQEEIIGSIINYDVCE